MKGRLSGSFLSLISLVLLFTPSCSMADKSNVTDGRYERIVLADSSFVSSAEVTNLVAENEIPDLAALEAIAPSIATQTTVLVPQSSGKDKSLYLFAGNETTESLYVYNLRLKEWNKADLPATCPKVLFNEGMPFGSAHIALLYEGAENLDFYHTIGGTFVQYNVPGPSGRLSIEDGSICKYVPAEGGYMRYTLGFEKVRKGFTFVDTVVMVLYFLALVLIGVFFAKRQKTSDDYFKGGQRIPWWAAGLSLFATALSAITFMSIPAKAYATDWSYMLFNAGIVFVCPIIIYLFIPFFRKLQVATAYEFLEQRFNYATRLICSLAFIIYQVGRMGVVLYLPAIAIHIVTGVDIFLCIALMGVFSIIYTRMGGIEAVVWTDALQAIILLGGALFAAIHIFSSTGLSISDAIGVAQACDKFNMGSTQIDFTNATMWTVLIATFFTNLTTYGTDQSMVQRYMTTNSEKAARKSVLTNVVIVIPATIIFFLIGTALFVYYKTIPEAASI